MRLMKSKKNYKVVISDSAKADIKESAKWYNSRQKGLGKHFTQSIKECINTTKLQPESCRIRYKNNRVAIPYKFPFLIVYNIDDNNNTLNIIAVFHTKKKSAKLK